MTYKHKSIKEYMKANNLVYADMDKILGVDQSTAFRWAKNGITVDPLERFMKVSKRLSISPRDLRPDVYDMFMKGK
ncbi:MAG: helix-turn-helix transcriptional regulator [Planctomycetes bacterium]|nr:helix-turn-helix transcriptional regulator [Planctomycetota bacterium]